MIGCATEVTTSTKLQAGNWEMKFEVGDDANRVYIPIDIRVDSLGKITIHNDTEVIQLTEVIHKGDSVHARVAPYLSYLHWKEFNGDSISGYWEDASRDNYKVLFTATPHSENDVVKTAWQKTFDATFSYGTPDQYKAVGIFDRSDNDLSGTFMTETGDYRYLGGDIIDEEDEAEDDAEEFFEAEYEVVQGPAPWAWAGSSHKGKGEAPSLGGRVMMLSNLLAATLPASDPSGSRPHIKIQYASLRIPEIINVALSSAFIALNVQLQNASKSQKEFSIPEISHGSQIPTTCVGDVSFD
jgi:hypothetical protein